MLSQPFSKYLMRGRVSYSYAILSLQFQSFDDNAAPYGFPRDFNISVHD